ncbi:lanthionine synthetase C family protein [Romboutsia sedimentorum]|uniref:Lanthionine synthetase C family protein n=1 Tax=Romboutsia sedimentorum TaxID=1368474 RepID=A0ABT7EE65_9FIRM|nr:lanthionine synthetase C family protein [Romboutsia sedimentorum]MDK2564231.1 lanthionine synthetase C family protein [Romboutsia sedimentorum]
MEEKLINKNIDIEKMVYDTAIKLLDYDKIVQSSKEDKYYLEVEGEKFNIYDELTLSDGLPSLCILYGELNEQYPEEEWDIKGHEYIKKIVPLLENRSDMNLSMFSGLSGIGLSTVCLSKSGKRYKNFISSVNSLIKNNLENTLKHLEDKSGLSDNDYDAISGISGVLNYCMLFKDDMKKEINKMLKYIVNLSKYKKNMEIEVPGWYIESNNLHTKKEKEIWANGFFNIGLSHGIPSLLINLCNAKQLGIEVDGQQEAIEKFSSFLFNYRLDEKNGYGWNYTVSFEDYKNNTRPQEYCRDAWCYGTPGVAYSLLIAGKTLNNNEYINYAIESMKIAAKRSKDAISPTFCHGYSGIAYISNRFYELTNINEFKSISLELCDKVISFYNEKNRFNFIDVEKKEDKICYYNSVGIIEGVVGIILTLLSIKNGRKTPWDTAFSLNDYKNRI